MKKENQKRFERVEEETHNLRHCDLVQLQGFLPSVVSEVVAGLAGIVLAIAAPKFDLGPSNFSVDLISIISFTFERFEKRLLKIQQKLFL